MESGVPWCIDRGFGEPTLLHVAPARHSPRACEGTGECGARPHGVGYHAVGCHPGTTAVPAEFTKLKSSAPSSGISGRAQSSFRFARIAVFSSSTLLILSSSRSLATPCAICSRAWLATILPLMQVSCKRISCGKGARQARVAGDLPKRPSSNASLTASLLEDSRAHTCCTQM